MVVPVVGCQRSGTTLLGQILGVHPNAVLIDEDDHLYSWTDAALHTERRARADMLLRRSLRSSRSKYENRRSRVRWTGSPRDNLSHIILQAPNLTFDFEAIADRWPTTPVVYVRRDIRAVVASALALDDPIAKNQLRRIRSSAALAEMFVDDLAQLERLGPDAPHLEMAMVAKMKMSLGHRFRAEGLRVLDVKYESLVASPECEIPRVLEHAGLRLADECFAHETSLTGVGPGRTERSRGIDGNSVRSWEAQLSNEWADEIWDLVGAFLAASGYER